MTDPKHIPHLIQLLDEESPEILNRIQHELLAFGPNLKDQLKKLPLSLNSLQKQRLREIIRQQKRVVLRQSWTNWLYLPSNMKKWEKALSFLAEYLSEEEWDIPISVLLDGLAYAYKEKYDKGDPLLLADFLFKEKGLKGDEDDYYNPQNSNLAYVIREKKGIPISLASVYILVGSRLGLGIQGCNFPGHFLAKMEKGGKSYYVDCFSSGLVIEEKDILQAKEHAANDVQEILIEKTEAELIVKRFLANLIRAFEMREEEQEVECMVDFFKELERYAEEKKVIEIKPEDILQAREPIFHQGQLVRHKRYGYRGIVVDMDEECYATDSWYYGNQTQPSREQAWYHVLVDGSDQVTYVAESNLVEDGTIRKISHPLISYFFIQTADGKYIRNDNPWPETDY